MNNSYKNAMDKIVLSDEEKEKIIKTALLKTKSKKRPVYKYAANIAAGVIICLVSIPVTGIFLNPKPDYVPVITETPSPEATPLPSAPPAQTAEVPQSTAAPKAESTKAPQAKQKSETPAAVQKQPPKAQSTPQAAAKQAETVPERNLPAEKESDTSAAMNFAEDTGEENSVQSFASGTEYSSGGASADTAVMRSVSPYQSYKTADELVSAVSFTPIIPKISGYDAEETTVLFGTIVQIIYTNGSSQLVYRTCEGNEDCSGDYGNYEKAVSTVLGGTAVTLKTDKNLGTLIVWSGGGMSFSLHSDSVLTESEAESIISEI